MCDYVNKRQYVTYKARLAPQCHLLINVEMSNLMAKSLWSPGASPNAAAQSAVNTQIKYMAMIRLCHLAPGLSDRACTNQSLSWLGFFKPAHIAVSRCVRHDIIISCSRESRTKSDVSSTEATPNSGLASWPNYHYKLTSNLILSVMGCHVGIVLDWAKMM